MNKTGWQLPEYMIGGTLFCYNAKSDEFIERDVPSNRIAMGSIWERDQMWTQFFFDERKKNLYTGGFPNGEPPRFVHLVLIPNLPYCASLGMHVKTYHEKEAENQKEHAQKLQGLERNRRRFKRTRRIS